jgi:hypothetical protein
MHARHEFRQRKQPTVQETVASQVVQRQWALLPFRACELLRKGMFENGDGVQRRKHDLRVVVLAQTSEEDP